MPFGFSLQYPRSDQRLYSFKSVQLLSGADVFRGLTAASVKPSVEGRELVYGNGTKAYGRPRGHLKVEAKCKFIADAFFEWASANAPILDTEFSFSFEFAEGPQRNVIDIIQLCFDEAPVETEGTDATEVELSGMAVDCLIDGKSLMRGDALGFLGLGVSASADFGGQI